MSRILRGERRADPETLQAIGRALKIPVTIMYQAAGLLPADEGSESNQWADEMAYKLTQLSPGARAIAERFINSMVEGEEASQQKDRKSRKPAPVTK